MTVRNLVYVSNTFDETTRHEREVRSDSPAASRKTLATCAALRHAGVRAVVLSMGRGRADGQWRYHRPALRRVEGIPVIYLPFQRIRGLSELLSMSALVLATHRLRRLKGRRTFFFYNRTAAYVPALIATALMRERRVLDLEDGNFKRTSLAARIKTFAFRRLCTQGTVLANSALGARDVEGPTLCYYGATARRLQPSEWNGEVNVLLGGTIAADTGADLLAHAIEQLRARREPWATRLNVFITGKGDSLTRFESLAAEDAAPRVTVHGRLDDSDYDTLLSRMNVGLALKLNAGELATTTFPSKVVEMAGAGLLIVTTDISDVRRVFGEGALYLQKDSADALVKLLRWICENQDQAKAIATRGSEAVRAECHIDVAGRRLADFLFPGGT
jgi:glycosyltransferase involved in cell wall biosynthesis